MRDSHMRAAVAVVTATLTLGLGYGSALAQTGAGWLGSIHMFDALTGWAVDAEGAGEVAAKGAVESVVRTTTAGSIGAMSYRTPHLGKNSPASSFRLIGLPRS